MNLGDIFHQYGGIITGGIILLIAVIFITAMFSKGEKNTENANNAESALANKLTENSDLGITWETDGDD